eukprot:scaffold49502_cov53-Attheya_sp.AAC.3
MIEGVPVQQQVAALRVAVDHRLLPSIVLWFRWRCEVKGIWNFKEAPGKKRENARAMALVPGSTCLV